MSLEIRQALAKLLAMTMEPKSADIRRLSQKVIIGFFDLNPATLTLLLRNMTKTLQESANRILKGYMNDMSSSSGDESDKEATPKKVRRRAGAAMPTGGRTTPSGLRVRNRNSSGYVIIWNISDSISISTQDPSEWQISCVPLSITPPQWTKGA